MNKKIIVLALMFIGMVAGASATLGSPSTVEVNACSNFFDDCEGSEDVIVMEWTDNQFDSSTVTVSADDISSSLDQGEVENSFTMQITGSQSQAVYDVRDGGRNDLYGVDARSNKWAWCQKSLVCGGNDDYSSAPSKEDQYAIMDEWAKSNSYDLNGDGQITVAKDRWTEGWANQIVNARAYTLDRGSKFANVGDISTDPREEMATTFNVGGVEKTLSNSDIGRGQTANFGGQVKINFRGGLESGYNFPIMDDSLVVYNDQRFNGFRVVSKSAIDSEYPSFLENMEGDLSTVEDWANGDDSEEGIETRANNKLEDVTQEYDRSELFDHEYSIEGSEISSGQITVEGNQQYSYPSFQVFIKGDELQYNIPDADPEIESISAPDEIKEGDPGEISVRVKNEDSATGDGDFSIRVTDTSQGFVWNGIAKDVNGGDALAPGEASTETLSISYGENSDQKRNDGTVTVEVQNLRDTSETVTREVSLTGVQSNDCTPGNYPTNENDDGTIDIYKCSDDGQSEEKIATCGAEERVKTLNDGAKTCVDDIDDVKDDPEDDNPEDGDGSGQKKVWIPTQGDSRCISQVVDEGTQLDPSFSSQSECESSLSGNVGCAIQVPSLNPASYFNPVEEPESTGFICGENKVYANVLLTLFMGLIGVGTGRRLGGAVEPEGENNVTYVLASGLGVLGAVIGFAVISVAQALGFVLISLMVYGVYKFLMYYTGAEALKELVV